MPKHSSIKDAVAAADRQRIVMSLGSLKSYWEKGRWLGANNRYKQETSKQVKADAGGFTDSNLTEYIGASTLGHCFDGWSYLGRATEAELAGDPGSARHLGYYAELRAAMSLLAGDGIGIFNNSHVSVNGSGDVLELRKRRWDTHNCLAGVGGVVEVDCRIEACLGSHQPGWCLVS